MTELQPRPLRRRSCKQPKALSFEHVEVASIDLDPPAARGRSPARPVLHARTSVSVDAGADDEDLDEIEALLRAVAPLARPAPTTVSTVRLSAAAGDSHRCATADCAHASIPLVDVLPATFADDYLPDVFRFFPAIPGSALLETVHRFSTVARDPPPRARRLPTSPLASRPASPDGTAGPPRDWVDALVARRYPPGSDLDALLRRPSFTSRPLVDWDRNDLRALCFVPSLDPLGFGGRRPALDPPSFEIVVLPLAAADDEIVATLAGSALYAEFTIPRARREALARDTLAACAGRRPGPLARGQWRRILDNYLLALGCEAQAMLDFQTTILRRSRLKQQARSQSQQSLLKRVLMRCASARPAPPGAVLPSQAPLPPPVIRTVPVSASPLIASLGIPKIELQFTISEQRQVWRETQLRIFRRLGLAWDPTDLPMA
ncbi:uncharacterized protein V1510DRAFT_442631 [Dipodascopsis tothii]|uniref:uncharacterized protein n=1 Tax=Dipodascopsis tothii TaxID=44089 RepID=UPI0034CEECCA